MSRGDLSVHRWVIERVLMDARKRGQPFEVARARQLLVSVDALAHRQIRQGSLHGAARRPRAVAPA
jgi:hypothetical protein